MSGTAQPGPLRSQAPPPTTNPLAVPALVCGIAAAVLLVAFCVASCMLVAYGLEWRRSAAGDAVMAVTVAVAVAGSLVAVAGVALGIAAVVRAKAAGGLRRRMAHAGLWLAASSLVGGGVLASLLVLAIGLYGAYLLVQLGSMVSGS